MGIAVKEWVQDTFVVPGVSLFAKAGDYHSVSNLVPSADTRQLKRLPAWSSQVRTDTNGLSAVQGIFYDAANSRVVLVGGDSVTSNLTSAYLDSSWSLSAETELHATPSNLGGLSLRNLVYWGAYLWLIGSDQKVYRGASYTGALAEFDSSTNHRILTNIDEKLYVVKDNGTIERNNSDLSAFSTYCSPNNDLDIRWFGGFRSYGLAIARGLGGQIELYQVLLDVDSGSRYFNQITSLPVGGVLPSYGSLFAMHDDEVYFSPGYYSLPGGQIGLDVYKFNGSHIDHVAQVAHDPNAGGSGVPMGAGLISWRHDLIYYALEGTAQTFKVLKEGKFTDFPALGATATATPIAVNAGGYLVTVADDTNEGIHYLTDAALDDGYVISSWLDMGSPGRQKRLLRISVLLSEAATDFKVVVKYRTDDTTSWTTAGTTNGSRRACVQFSTSVTFHTLQLRIDLDDDTGNNEDIAIDAVSVMYAIGDN